MASDLLSRKPVARAFDLGEPVTAGLRDKDEEIRWLDGVGLSNCIERLSLRSESKRPSCATFWG